MNDGRARCHLGTASDWRWPEILIRIPLSASVQIAMLVLLSAVTCSSAHAQDVTTAGGTPLPIVSITDSNLGTDSKANPFPDFPLDMETAHNIYDFYTNFVERNLRDVQNGIDGSKVIKHYKDPEGGIVLPTAQEVADKVKSFGPVVLAANSRPIDSTQAPAPLPAKRPQIKVSRETFSPGHCFVNKTEMRTHNLPNLDPNIVLRDILYVEKGSVPEDIGELIGKDVFVQVVPKEQLPPEHPVAIQGLIDQVECLPFRVRVTGAMYYRQMGDNALLAYGKQPNGPGNAIVKKSGYKYVSLKGEKEKDPLQKKEGN